MKQNGTISKQILRGAERAQALGGRLWEKGERAVSRWIGGATMPVRWSEGVVPERGGTPDFSGWQYHEGDTAIRGLQRVFSIPRMWPNVVVANARQDEIDTICNEREAEPAIAYAIDGKVHVGRLREGQSLTHAARDANIARVAFGLGSGPSWFAIGGAQGETFYAVQTMLSSPTPAVVVDDLVPRA